MKEYLAAKLAAKRKDVRVVTRKGPPKIDKLPQSLALAIQKALAERIALKVLTSYTQATLPSNSATAGTSETSLPPSLATAEIVPFDGTEGHTDEEASHAAGREINFLRCGHVIVSRL